MTGRSPFIRPVFSLAQTRAARGALKTELDNEDLEPARRRHLQNALAHLDIAERAWRRAKKKP